MHGEGLLTTSRLGVLQNLPRRLPGGGLGFRVWGLGFGVCGLVFRVWGLGFRV